mgnify:CR=1 FL=1
MTGIRSFVFALLAFGIPLLLIDAILVEESVRVAEHDKRYTRQWPPEKYAPDTVGWKKLMDRRFRQVAGMRKCGQNNKIFVLLLIRPYHCPSCRNYLYRNR